MLTVKGFSIRRLLLGLLNNVGTITILGHLEMGFSISQIRNPYGIKGKRRKPN
jgi:hypothetical protein